jgi:hypothetical protein
MKTEQKLKIKTVKHAGRHMAYFDLVGVSINGFGDTPDEAKYTLLLRLLETAPSHMHHIVTALEHDLERLNYGYEFTDNGVRIHINDVSGRTQVIEWRKNDG